MATSSLSVSNWKYNIDGGSWQQGSGRSLSIGRTNTPQIFRGWISFSLASFSSAYIMQASSLYFKRYDSYGSIRWDIGLRSSEPSKTFSQSDFTVQIANDYVNTSQGEYTVSITADQIKQFIGGTVYVCFCGYSTSSYCYGEVDMQTNTPKLNVGYLYAKSTISSATNGTIGSQQTITVSRQDSSYTHTLTATCAGRTETIATQSSATSFTWTPSVANFATLITTAMSASCTYTLTTYYGSTSVGNDTKSVTLSLPSASVAPTLDVSVTDNNGYASHFNGKYIVGKSAFRIVATPAFKYGATQSSISISANGSTYSSSPATTSVVRSGQSSISATVKDSRSQTASASASVTLLAYASPNLSVNVQRCTSGGTADSSGAYCKVTSTYSITALDNINTRALTVKYKKSSDGSYTDVSRTLSSYAGTDEYIFAADTDSSYNIQVVIEDYFSTATSTKALSTAAVVFDIYQDGTGMAFGKVAESGNLFDVAWPIIMRNTDLSINDSSGTRRILARADNGGNSNITLYDSNGQYRVLIEDDRINLYQSDGSWVAQFLMDGSASSHPLPLNQGGTGQTSAFPKHKRTTGSVSASYGNDVTICSLTLPKGYSYLVFGWVKSSISQSGSIVNARISGMNWGSEARATMSNGGGVFTAGLAVVSGSDLTTNLSSYGYYNGTYTLSGGLLALQFADLPSF